jgi:hypothetical protein
MSWASALRYASAAISRQSGQHAAVDVDLPLGARIGSVVTIQSAPFLRSAAAGGLVLAAAPGAQIVAISRIKMPLAGKLFRYYLTTANDLAATESFLQLHVDPDGAVLDACYYRHLNRLYPASSEEQVAFTGEAGHGLGDRSFSISRLDLLGAGVDSATAEAALGGTDEVAYQREAGAPDADFVAPYRGTEVRVDDPNGEHGLSQEIWFMSYARVLSDGLIERLLISTEVIQSVDGDASKRSVHVDFMIGIPLERERITVQ